MSSAVKRWDGLRWVPRVAKSHDGARWSKPSDVMTLRQSPFDPYIGRGSIWQRDVSSMPLATKSADQAAWVASHVNYGSGFGPTSINGSNGGTRPILPVMIDSRLDSTPHNIINVTGWQAATGDPYGKQLFSQPIPLPAWVDGSTTQNGQDSALALVDVGTGVIREFYGVHPQSGYVNQMTASGNAYSIFEPDPFEHGWPTGIYRTGGYEEDAYTTRCQVGLASVVGMHNWLGWIDIAGARRGRIDHAIAWTCANLALPDSLGEAIDPDGQRYVTKGPSWPAKGGDGDTANPSDQVPIHGQWARLPLDLDLSPSGPYPPFLRVVLQAIQTYGMVCTDSNNFVHAFNAEPGFFERSFLGVDPWSSSGDLYKRYAQLNLDEGRADTPFSMAAFPWALTEWAPRHWGAPTRINPQP